MGKRATPPYARCVNLHWDQIMTKRGCLRLASTVGTALAVFGVLSGAHAACFLPDGSSSVAAFGDVTNSGSTNVADALCVVLESLAQLEDPPAPAPACFGDAPRTRSDLSCDGATNVTDVVQTIYLALIGSIPASSDADGDGCADACISCFGAAPAACLVDGVCVAAGASNPAEPCERCEIGADELNWTVLPDGTSCGADGTCDAGVCSSSGEAIPAGCESAACTACVCGIDSFCCDSGWDDLCTAISAVECDGDCSCELPPPTGGDEPADCCEPTEAPGCLDATCEACVCDADPFCCEASWDGLCVGRGSTTCAADCGCSASPADCCAAATGPGCGDTGCEACVCALDSFCCELLWDGACGQIASSGCSESCGCGQPLGPCCSPHAGSGCLSSECESCVCALDASCCTDEWTASCAALSNDACDAECGCPAQGGPCCAAHNGGGCDDSDCSACVCGSDPFCCDSGWDAVCIAAASSFCEPDCSCATEPESCCEAHASASCDVPSCSECVCTLDPTCCTLAWDASCVASALGPCTTDCDCAPGACCEPNGGLGCEDPACSGCVCGVDPLCCVLGWDADCTDIASLQCNAPCNCEPETPAEEGGACCSAHPSPSCDSAACSSCVCALDSACCESTWASGCADQALTSCAAECLCPAQGGPCCEAHNGAGCSTDACSTCVCAIDGFCCDVTWDPLCAARAESDCEVDCACEEATVDPPEPPSACCAASAEAGCADAPCESCVCSLDSSCCGAEWTPFCVLLAATACEPACSCAKTCEGAAGDCASANGSQGCAEAACCGFVCGADSFCCEVLWDEGCAQSASNLCALPPSCPPEDPACFDCGDGTCGTLESCSNCPSDCGQCPACPPPSCADAARTVFLGGPGNAACSLAVDDTECQQAYIQGGGGVASCFVDGDTGDCLGCGTSNEVSGLCTNACTGPPACPLDPARTLTPSGAGSMGCSTHDGDPAACEAAFIEGGSGIASCFFTASTGKCRGCGVSNAQSGLCSNSCAPPFACPEDPTRTDPVLGPEFVACESLEFPGQCARAFYLSDAGETRACFWSEETSECLSCDTFAEEDGDCTNTCRGCE